MKTFKHKKTGHIIYEINHGKSYTGIQYYCSNIDKNINLPESLLKGSNDWEEVIKGNTYYIVEGSLLEPYKIKKFKNNTTIYSGDVIFTTKEEAEDYIILNKPCLSIKDIAPIIGFCNNTTYVDLDLLTEKLKKLVKSKI